MNRESLCFSTTVSAILAVSILFAVRVCGEDAGGAKVKVTLNFTNAAVKQVLRDYSEKTGLTLLSSSALPAARVTLVKEGELSLDEYGVAIEAALRDKGIAVVRAGRKFAKVLPWPKERATAGLEELAPATVTVDAEEPCGAAMRFVNAPAELFLVDYSDKARVSILVSTALPKVPVTLVTPTDLTHQEYLQAIENVLLLNGIKLIKLDDDRLGAIPAATRESELSDVISGLRPLPIAREAPSTSSIGTLEEVLRAAQGTNASQPIPLTQEQDDALVKRGVLPPLGTNRGAAKPPPPSPLPER